MKYDKMYLTHPVLTQDDFDRIRDLLAAPHLMMLVRNDRRLTETDAGLVRLGLLSFQPHAGDSALYLTEFALSFTRVGRDEHAFRCPTWWDFRPHVPGNDFHDGICPICAELTRRSVAYDAEYDAKDNEE